MQVREFGRLGHVGALSLGGGGTGQVRGLTTRAEAVATVHAAIDAGITYLDVAPTYGNGEAELVIREAFNGRIPAGVRISTKCRLFSLRPTARIALEESRRSTDGIIPTIEQILSASLDRMKLERIDLLFLHDYVVPDGSESTYVGLPRRILVDIVRPTFERLTREGRIGGWGISALGVAPAILDTLNEDPPPYAAQISTNLLDTAGALGPHADSPAPPQLATIAASRGVAVIGIQPTQKGALTDAYDRPMTSDSHEMALYQQATPFRALARELGESPASLAHRYALSLPGVSTVLLGVKNRTELRECLAAEAKGPLDQSLVARIDAAVARD